MSFGYGYNMLYPHKVLHPCPGTSVIFYRTHRSFRYGNGPLTELTEVLWYEYESLAELTKVPGTNT